MQHTTNSLSSHNLNVMSRLQKHKFFDIKLSQHGLIPFIRLRSPQYSFQIILPGSGRLINFQIPRQLEDDLKATPPEKM